MVHRNITLYALTFLICLSFQLAFAQFPRSVINEMSRREIRYRHYLWHNIRDNWNRYSSETRAEITRRGWAPPNPARSYDSNGNPVAITDNYAGEDFLYMHRQMINHARSIAGSRNARYFTGWNFIPAPGDRSYPVPPRYSVPGSSSTSSSINNRKSNAFYYDNIMPMEDLFNDPDELRSMTLAELGVRLENTIHNWCHIRFSSSESSYRPGGSGPFPIFDTIWDRPSYDWLGDTYSSHVSPLFWKIHGWVDNKIEAWRIANGLRRITWRGRWEGGPMSTLSDILNPGSTSSGVTAMAMTASLASEGNNSVERTESIVSEDFTGSSSDSFVPESSFADNVQIDLGSFGKAAASKVNPILRPKTPKTGPTRRLESKTSLRRT